MTMKPLAPVTEHGESVRDHAKNGYSLGALEDRLSDCRTQPDWRPRADLAHAYYDMGKQLTPEREHQIRVEMGIEPRQTNLVHGVINGVLGQEAKQRSDVRSEADDEDYADVADVFSMRMKEAQRESNSDMAISNGYAGQVKGGIGWVEVSRSIDPLDYPYRVREIHRNEIWWDMRAKHIGLDDAGWLVRKRWHDLDEAVAYMPEHKDVLMQSLNGWDLLALAEDETTMLGRAWRNERRTRILRDEWIDTPRRRVKLYEVWYRVPANVAVLHLSPTRRVVYNEKNPLHIELVRRQAVHISKSITMQMRMALFAGPHRLLDVGTTRRRFPYIPFFAFRDDEDGSPYGLIEGMISPQDEYNERRQMINWMLKARQLTMDSDALDVDFNTIADIAETAMRPDMVAVLNPNRRNANGFQITNDLVLQKEQIDVMLDAKQLIQDVPRVYSTQMGSAPSGVTSGIANSILVEQGLVAMGELNDNYRFGRQRVHEEMQDLIAEDHMQEELQVAMGKGPQRRVVILNTWDPETGLPKNRVQDAPVKVGMSDVPSSPAFRVQEQQNLATMIQALGNNPNALAILTPAYIEGSSLNNRQQMADDLRRATGVPVAGDREAQAQAQMKQQALIEQKQALEMAKEQAETEEAQSKVMVNEANATLSLAKARQIGAGIVLDSHAAQMQEQAAMPGDEDMAIDEALAEAETA